MRRQIGYVIAVALACEGEPTTPQQLAPCPVETSVAITSSATPTFSWIPHCGVHAVSVRDANNPSDIRWSVTELAGGLVPSPIVYGQAPAGTTATAAGSLVPGTTYTVNVSFPAVGGFTVVQVGTVTP